MITFASLRNLSVGLSQTLAALFDLSVLGLSALLYRGLPSSRLPDYPLQVVLLFSLAGGLTLFSALAGPRLTLRRILLTLRSLVFGLVITTIPVIDLRALPLVMGFTLFTALGASTLGFIVYQSLWSAVPLGCFLLFPELFPVPPWNQETQLLLGTMIAVVTCALLFRFVVDDLKANQQRVAMLDRQLGRLTNANIGFQEFAAQLERESTHAERLRLSREIHDSVGYTLTTLKMLFEAAKGLMVKDPTRLGGLMDEGADLSAESLRDVRMILRELRSKVDESPRGMNFVHRLVKNFEAACGLRVRLEFTNTRNSYGPDLDAILYRMIQEGMTNAFHHGQATELTIILTEQTDQLSVFIRDNGQGSPQVTKGIGLSGMEERIAEAGGSIYYQTTEGGFELSATLPIAGVP